MAHLALAPTQIYPLFETALRAAAGRTVDEHQRHVSELWARFAAVAADEPARVVAHARTRAEEIRTVSPDNRMVCFPYPKRMCANIDVDQAAALLLCSYEAARAAGVPDERMVFPLAAADAHDHYFFSERVVARRLARDRGRGRRRARRGRASASTTSRASTSTRASRRRCRSRCARSGSRPTTTRGRSRSPAASASRAARSTTTRRTRSRAWSRPARRSRLARAARPRSAGTSPSTRSACTRPRRPRTGSAASTRRRARPQVDALPGREPAGLVDDAATSRRRRSRSSATARPALGIVTALTADGRRVLANTRDADAAASR